MRETHRPFEIIVVDDGSTDSTPLELASCAYEPHLLVLRHDTNRGYGYSIKRAVAQAQYETLVLTDADGTYPIERIPELLSMMDGADMVVGARIGENVKIPLARRPAKWVLRRLAEYLTRTEIPDLNSGLRVMKRSLVRRFLPLLPDGFSLTTTITLASLTHQHPVKFVPIDYAKRVGTSSIRPLRDTINFLGLVVRTVMYFRPLKIFAPVSAAILLTAVAVALGTKLAFGQVADVTAVTLAVAAVQVLAIGLLADLIDKRSPAYPQVPTT
jgi:glycosyltransferase involved in cell wall biosynthesis